MKAIIPACAAACAIAIGVAAGGPAWAQGAPQTVEPMRVDAAKVATGFRSSKIVGGTVVNQNNERIGTVDDLIIEPGEGVPFAILSVGGFLGIGDRHVAVPFSRLNINEDRIELPDATKDQLIAMPEFQYATK